MFEHTHDSHNYGDSKMTTEATKAAIEAIDEATKDLNDAQTKLEVAEEAIAGRSYSPKYAKLNLDEAQQNIAAGLLESAKTTDKGVKWNRKDYYDSAESQGITKSTLQTVERFNENFATSVHAVTAELALARFKEDPEAGEYSSTADMGENTRYEDTVKRFDSRSVSTGIGGERRLQETYAYHNPSIKTKYKGFEEQRKLVNNLAKDLFS